MLCASFVITYEEGYQARLESSSAKACRRPKTTSFLPLPIASARRNCGRSLYVHYDAMSSRLVPALISVVAIASCGEPLKPPLPALMEAAHSTGGTNSLCEPSLAEGSTPETASHSPEMVQRLKRSFPVGTPASKLREELVQQGFQLEKACSPDGSVSLAWFRQSGGNGITTMPAFGSVYWKADASGNLIWVTGDIAFTGL